MLKLRPHKKNRVFDFSLSNFISTDDSSHKSTKSPIKRYRSPFTSKTMAQKNRLQRRGQLVDEARSATSGFLSRLCSIKKVSKNMNGPLMWYWTVLALQHTDSLGLTGGGASSLLWVRIGDGLVPPYPLICLPRWSPVLMLDC